MMLTVLRPLIVFLFFFGFVSAQNFDSVCLQQRHVLGTIAAHHYDPPQYNAATNAQVLDIFLKEADEKNIVFMASDREALLQTVNAAGDNNEIHCLLIRQSFSIYNRRLLQLDSIIGKIEKRKLVFNADDSISFSFRRKDRSYCTSTAEIYTRIEKRIRYECLPQIISTVQQPERHWEVEFTDKTVIEKTALQKSVKRLRQYLAKYQDAGYLKQYLGDCMSNAIAQRSDPHTGYFNTKQIRTYHSALFMEESSFGFTVKQDENGNIRISELSPGGPAWKSEGLNEKDMILSFRFDNEEEVPVENSGIEDFYENFYKSDATKVELKVLKKDLKINTVVLEKEKVRSEESMLSSFVIREGGQRIGYIPIPGFYLDQRADSRQGLANDVASEIIELKLDSISGLIIDLRYNGGGSMREAMGLAGIFIDEGPVAIYKPRQGPPFLLKDLNRGSIWDGPLLVLVNGASASASEFVAAALQDYNRAIVVGSATFGKGTAQSVIMADSMYYFNDGQEPGESPFGFMKITSGRFYRLSKESHQGKGIEPDVVIPGIVENVMEKEAADLFAFRPDSIEKEVEFARMPPLPVMPLRQMSAERIRTSPKFSEILVIGDSLRRNRSKSEKIALTPRDYAAYTLRQKQFSDRVEALLTTEEDVPDISANSQNHRIIAMSGYQRKNYENEVTAMKKDLVLRESINIMGDMIQLLEIRGQ